MATTSALSLVQTSSIGQFLWHRVARIYPAFFAAVAVACGLSWIFSGHLPGENWRSLTLLPLRIYGPLQVEWTLNYEVTFYIITLLFCLSAFRKGHCGFLVAWAAVILLNAHVFLWYHNGQFPLFYQLPFSVWTLSFVTGGLAYYAVAKFDYTRSFVLQVGPYSLVVTLIVALFGMHTPAIMVGTLPLFLAVVVAYSFNCDLRWRSSFLMRLGDRSYGIYLIHQVACAFAIGLLAPHISSPWVIYGVLIGLSLHLGSMLGAADVRCYRQLKQCKLLAFKGVEVKP
jgi:peptidoglycan/LPS O-acetylase OafA/YrhL